MFKYLVLALTPSLYAEVSELLQSTDIFSKLDLFDFYETPESVLCSSEAVFISDRECCFRKLLSKGYYLPTVGIMNPGILAQSLESASCIIESPADLTWDCLNFVYSRFYGLPITQAETKRCIIKELSLKDIPALYRLYESTDLPSSVHPLSSQPKQEADQLKSYIKYAYGYYGLGLWGIFDKENMDLIGRCGIEFCDQEEGFELAYLISGDYQKQGIGFEVCTKIIELACNYFHLDRLLLRTDSQNRASIKLAGKLGFLLKEQPDTFTEQLIFEKLLHSGFSPCKN